MKSIQNNRRLGTKNYKEIGNEIIKNALEIKIIVDGKNSLLHLLQYTQDSINMVVLEKYQKHWISCFSTLQSLKFYLKANRYMYFQSGKQKKSTP